MVVASLRHIQAIHEVPEQRNPDVLVSELLPESERERLRHLEPGALSKVRSDPFYYYLLTRTRHYDQVLSEAVAAGAGLVICVGSGSDTRAYRFQELLRRHGVKVIECDQRPSILAKRELAARWNCGDFVQYAPIDLNNGAWPWFQLLLQSHAGRRALVFMEGVAPYISHRSFGRFLQLLRENLAPGSEVAYDFKFVGARDEWGRVGLVHTPFRLPRDRAQVESYHAELGFRMTDFAMTAELSEETKPPFPEDGLVRLEVAAVEAG